MAESSRVTFRIEDSILQKVDEKAKSSGVERSAFIRSTLENVVNGEYSEFSEFDKKVEQLQQTIDELMALTVSLQLDVEKAKNESLKMQHEYEKTLLLYGIEVERREKVEAKLETANLKLEMQAKENDKKSNASNNEQTRTM